MHAARKWLVGDSVPTQEKLRMLAHWLGVSAEWLRYGTRQPQKTPKPADVNFRLGPRDLAILESMRRLDEKKLHIVHTLIRMLDPGE